MTKTTTDKTATTKSKPSSDVKVTRSVTKRDQLVKLLSRKGGATIAQLEEKLRWQPHTVRAAISGLRKTDHEIERENLDGKKGSIYRLVTQSKVQPSSGAKSESTIDRAVTV